MNFVWKTDEEEAGSILLLIFCPLATRASPIHPVDEFIPLSQVLLRKMRMLGESKVLSFVFGVNQENGEVGWFKDFLV